MRFLPTLLASTTLALVACTTDRVIRDGASDAAVSDATPEIDADAPHPCELIWRESADGPPVAGCGIVDVTEATASVCEQIAVCVCGMLGDGMVPPDRCEDALLLPRGAITLADFCSQPGLTVADVVKAPGWLEAAGPVRHDWVLGASAACEAVMLAPAP